VTEPVLIHVLANAAQALATSDAPEASIEQLLASIDGQLGSAASVGRLDGAVTVTWHDGHPGEDRRAFADTLAALIELAGRARERELTSILDAQSFAGALDRVAAGARWRGARMAIAVFELDGMLLGPGIDESLLVETVGQAARRVVRSNDIVGHLGASQFSLLFPRAGTFEARSAFRRVRDAVMQFEGGEELACGSAGFAELEPGQTGAELLNQARTRMAAARVRSAYTSPGGGSPTQPLAS
jgi:GGDEF domain-containing protein